MIVLFCVVLATIAVDVNGFAKWMESDYCDTPLTPGTIIMNNAALPDDSRDVRVFRGEKELEHLQEQYVVGETLTIEL
jgi:hypothetical protein